MDSRKTKVDSIIKDVKNYIISSNINNTEEEIYEYIEEKVLSSGAFDELIEVEETIRKIYAKTRNKLGIIEEYVKHDEINEIMINGKERMFLEGRNGIVSRNFPFDTTEELEEIIRNIAASVHREINEMNPILDARLDDGSRVNAVFKNIAVNGPILTIRKFPKGRITIKSMINRNTITEECANFLKILVESGFNIFVSGGTSSGKTTFLNALSDYIPAGERVIVIEDSTELQLMQIDNLVQMECHNANTIGEGKVSMDMLIKTSLRMRPDRIIVGEVRGREVADMLQAMNTGHDGSMSTGHGNSVSGMLRRLEAMYLMSAQIPMDAIRAQIIEGIDIMIHLGRLSDGRRIVMEVAELVGYENEKYVINSLFKIDNKFNLVRTDNNLINDIKLILKGYGSGRKL